VKIAIVGVGQDMRGDDGAGLAAVQLWQQEHAVDAASPDIRVRFVTVPGLELLDALAEVQAAVVVDAMSGGGEPGTILALGASELEVGTPRSGSLHGWGLLQELALGRLLGELPAYLLVRLLGIEASQIQQGSALSPVVQAALPVASARIQAEIHRFRRSEPLA
jgi:hydrogenase maturation protease